MSKATRLGVLVGLPALLVAVGAVPLLSRLVPESFPIAQAPSVDPRTGARYDRPAVRIAASVPLRTPVLGALVFQPVTTVSVLAVSSPR